MDRQTPYIYDSSYSADSSHYRPAPLLRAGLGIRSGVWNGQPANHVVIHRIKVFKFLLHPLWRRGAGIFRFQRGEDGVCLRLRGLFPLLRLWLCNAVNQHPAARKDRAYR